jgi:hypothetical protein
MKYPKTIKGKLSLLLKICELTSEECGDNEQENMLINNCVAHIQNELGDNYEILKKYRLVWNG